MKKIIISLSAAFVAAMTAQAKIDLVTLPKRQSVQLTIYNSADMTLARDRRELTLGEGRNRLEFSWANTLIDPTSLELLPMRDADRILVHELAYPPRVRELGVWTLDSKLGGPVPFEITYLTSGLSWRAFYMATLSRDEKAMTLEGYVVVSNNSGEDYAEAQTRLIVGQVHLLDRIADLARREYPYGRPDMMPQPPPASAPAPQRAMKAMVNEAMDMAFGAEMAPKEIVKEGLSEYFLYSIPGAETIPNGWSKRLLSLGPIETPVENLFRYEEERYGATAVRILSFRNDEEHNLGQTPIPDGTLMAYRLADDERHLSFEGRSSFKYIPVGEKVELNMGGQETVIVKPKLMDFRTDQHLFDKDGNISGWDEIRVFKIEVTNTREIPVKTEIIRHFPTQYWSLERRGKDAKDVEYEQENLNTVKFTLALEPRTKKTFEYELTTRHGLREQAGGRR